MVFSPPNQNRKRQWYSTLFQLMDITFPTPYPLSPLGGTDALPLLSDILTYFTKMMKADVLPTCPNPLCLRGDQLGRTPTSSHITQRHGKLVEEVAAVIVMRVDSKELELGIKHCPDSRCRGD